MRFRPKLVSGFALLALLAAAPAVAQTEVRSLGRFGDWSTYTYLENGNPVCYAASTPTRSRGNVKSRGDVFFLVTHRPEYDDVGVVTIVAGYPYAADSTVAVAVGKTKFRFFTRDETAWANGKDDRAAVAAMKRGNTMTVSGRSKSGVATTDTFSLSGLTKAYQAISSACKVKD